MFAHVPQGGLGRPTDVGVERLEPVDKDMTRVSSSVLALSEFRRCDFQPEKNEACQLGNSPRGRTDGEGRGSTSLVPLQTARINHLLLHFPQLLLERS